MSAFTIHARWHVRPGWLHWLFLSIAIGTVAIGLWYALPLVTGPFSWMMDTVIPVWVKHNCICILQSQIILC